MRKIHQLQLLLNITARVLACSATWVLRRLIFISNASILEACKYVHSSTGICGRCAYVHAYMCESECARVRAYQDAWHVCAHHSTGLSADASKSHLDKNMDIGYRCLAFSERQWLTLPVKQIYKYVYFSHINLHTHMCAFHLVFSPDLHCLVHHLL